MTTVMPEKKSIVRHRAWWLMRIYPSRFTVEQLLEIVSDGTEANARHNLNSYLNGLEKMGIVRRQQRDSKSTIYWSIIKDVGRKPPVVSNAKSTPKEAESKPLAIGMKRPARGDVIDVEAVVV